MFDKTIMPSAITQLNAEEEKVLWWPNIQELRLLRLGAKLDEVWGRYLVRVLVPDRLVKCVKCLVSESFGLGCSSCFNAVQAESNLAILYDVGLAHYKWYQILRQSEIWGVFHTRMYGPKLRNWFKEQEPHSVFVKKNLQSGSIFRACICMHIWRNPTCNKL